MVQRIIFKYFDNLFASNNPSTEMINKVIHCMKSKITNDVNELLIAEFTEKKCL